MRKIRNIVAVTGTYTKNGEEKNRYTRVGALLQDDADKSKLSIAFDGLPDSAILHAAKTGKDTIWLGCYPIDEEREQGGNSNYDRAQQQAAQPAPSAQQDGDDIPF